ncbi:MAG: NTP transferase domain-containing protein [Candidatus Methanospirareceae archaeon]
MIAIILAGGKGSRMRGEGEKKEKKGREEKKGRGGAETEKALIKIGGQRLIDSAVESVQASRAEGLLVAVTRNTPKTAEYCELVNYGTVKTPGESYHADLGFLLLRWPAFVSVACDIPFLQGWHLNALLDAFSHLRSCVSVTGAVPLDILPRGAKGGEKGERAWKKRVTPSYTFEHEGKTLVSCGINVVTNSEDSVPLVFSDPLLGVNVNTREDLENAQDLVVEHLEHLKKVW